MTLRSRAASVVGGLRARRAGKSGAELGYWRERRDAEGTLSNAHYEEFYTGQFGLTHDDYAGKRVLDIGCGPRGSLEWAAEAAERVGLDPLADDYRELGTDTHSMTYVAAGAERIPFEDGHFDVVTAMNSLDHVDDVDAAIAEMTRVTRPGGIALVLVEVDHPPTPTEPQSLGSDVLDRFAGGWSVDFQAKTGINAHHYLYDSWRDREPWTGGPGLIGARLTRR
jgi:SAM-dependent methyltransferase